MASTTCSNCEKPFEGTISECFIHDGKFCQDCEPCGEHSRDED